MPWPRCWPAPGRWPGQTSASSGRAGAGLRPGRLPARPRPCRRGVPRPRRRPAAGRAGAPTERGRLHQGGAPRRRPHQHRKAFRPPYPAPSCAPRSSSAPRRASTGPPVPRTGADGATAWSGTTSTPSPTAARPLIKTCSPAAGPTTATRPSATERPGCWPGGQPDLGGCRTPLRCLSPFWLTPGVFLLLSHVRGPVLLCGR